MLWLAKLIDAGGDTTEETASSHLKSRVKVHFARPVFTIIRAYAAGLWTVGDGLWYFVADTVSAAVGDVGEESTSSCITKELERGKEVVIASRNRRRSRSFINDRKISRLS